MLDGALEADAEVVGWEAEDFANGGGDAVAVCVDVVNCAELLRYFCCEATGERVRDLVEDVGCGGNSCSMLIRV